jgi:hypothetical protein
MKVLFLVRRLVVEEAQALQAPMAHWAAVLAQKEALGGGGMSTDSSMLLEEPVAG